MTNRPVIAGMNIYEDFLTYTGGVYIHTSELTIGFEFVRILGWGVENNTPYWLCSIAWGPYWGESGYFKILRGHDQCYIESYVSFVVPKINK